MDREDLRWRWYMDGVSEETRNYIYYELPVQEWQFWLQERALELIHKKDMPSIAKCDLKPLLRQIRNTLNKSALARTF